MNEGTENRPKFGLTDYWRMLAKRGPRLPILYFLNAHLFDLQHRTDTHVWLPKDRYESRPENFEHGVLYMSSWTREIKRSFNALRELADDLDTFTFIDIGCGKGKVVLLWRKLLARSGIRQAVYGVDYYPPFIRIAQENSRKMFSHSGNFLHVDATTLDYSRFGKKLIVYLYNPFGEVILRKVLHGVKNEDVFVIYNNPVHASVLHEFDYELIYEHAGPYPNSQTRIFRRHAKAIAASPSDQLQAKPARDSAPKVLGEQPSNWIRSIARAHSMRRVSDAGTRQPAGHRKP